MSEGIQKGIHMPSLLLLSFLGVSAILPCVLANQTLTRSKFKAAVYEHALILPGGDPKQIVTRQEALRLMMQNLDVFREQAAEAKRQGADILVFPEDGLYGFRFSWESMRPYLEQVPDPTVVDWVPCDDPTRFPNTEVQRELSCMAKNNSLYIVANMGDFQPCHPLLQASCKRETDGSEPHFQYNTDVAFDPTGKLVARYHKQHLFYEYQYSTPEKPEYAVFDTPFGRWGMFTCFDILFQHPAVSLVEREGIANIAFPTAWMDALPSLASVEFHSAWARGMGVNLLSANLHLPALRFQGSGVFTPEGMAAFTHNASLASPPRLLVAEIATLTKPSPQSALPALPAALTQASSQPTQTPSFSIPPDAQTVHDKRTGSEGQVSAVVTDYDVTPQYETAFVSELFFDLFNFVQLEAPNGTLKTCSNNVCCYVTYSMTPDPADLFAFGAFDGLHTYQGRYYLQICALVRCANQSRKSCGAPTNQSATSFHFLSMRGELETSHVFPEVLLTTPESYLRLAEAGEWRYDGGEIRSDRGFSSPLLAAALFGRDYFRDDFDLQDNPSDDADIGAAMTLTAAGQAWCLMTLCSAVFYVIRGMSS